MAFIDLPDWQIPISIAGITIASIPIDIVAQTIGVVRIDITSQTLGVVNVNIAAIGVVTMNVNIVGSVQLNVNIAAQTLAQVNVNIAASAVTLNVNLAASAITLNVNITGSIQLNVNIAAQTLAQVNVNIAASAITMNVNITGSIQLNVNIAASAITLNVNLASSAITLNVNISSVAGGVTFNVNITGSVALNVNATEVGVWNVNANITGSVALNVNVTGSVAINIQTSGGTNIIVDQLTQSAYTERRSIISNNGVVPAWDWSLNTSSFVGKSFPRGCRGWIDTIDVYCKDNGVGGGTITVYIAPNIGMGAITSVVIAVPAGGAAAWRSASFGRMWNSDSIFIWIVGSTTDMYYAFDAANPDSFYSTDDGLTWADWINRYWIRIDLKSETIGDVPVSGTINNIEIPNSISTKQQTALVVPFSNELYDTVQYGSGKLLIATFRTVSDASRNVLRPRIRCDGNQVLPHDLSIGSWYLNVITATTPGITIGVWSVGTTTYVVIVTLPYTFKRTLEVGFFNEDGGTNYTGYVAYSYTKIS